MIRILLFSLKQSIFLDTSGPDWLLKVLAMLELQTRSQSSPEKLLCSRLKSILITFRYKQYRNNYFTRVVLYENWNFTPTPPTEKIGLMYVCLYGRKLFIIFEVWKSDWWNEGKVNTLKICFSLWCLKSKFYEINSLLISLISFPENWILSKMLWNFFLKIF